MARFLFRVSRLDVYRGKRLNLSSQTERIRSFFDPYNCRGHRTRVFVRFLNATWIHRENRKHARQGAQTKMRFVTAAWLRVRTHRERNRVTGPVGSERATLAICINILSASTFSSDTSSREIRIYNNFFTRVMKMHRFSSTNRQKRIRHHRRKRFKYVTNEISFNFFAGIRTGKIFYNFYNFHGI